MLNFHVEGKLSKYNSEFNNINIFNNPDLLKTFIGEKDSIALLKALKVAQNIYI
jgi:hypothetical protein